MPGEDMPPTPLAEGVPAAATPPLLGQGAPAVAAIAELQSGQVQLREQLASLATLLTTLQTNIVVNNRAEPQPPEPGLQPFGGQAQRLGPPPASPMAAATPTSTGSPAGSPVPAATPPSHRQPAAAAASPGIPTAAEVAAGEHAAAAAARASIDQPSADELRARTAAARKAKKEQERARRPANQPTLRDAMEGGSQSHRGRGSIPLDAAPVPAGRDELEAAAGYDPPRRPRHSRDRSPRRQKEGDFDIVSSAGTSELG